MEQDLKTSIVIITYDKDLEFLKYSLKSIAKFCRFYNEVVVVIDQHENDCLQTQKYLESIGQKYFINNDAKHIPIGYIRQQHMKYFMEEYLDDADYVCSVDSDNIFYGDNKPSCFFKNGLPIIGMQKWSDMPNKSFKQCTNETLGFNSDYNFMRRMPLVYPLWLFKEVRDYIEAKHSQGFLSYFKNLRYTSEYNILGAYAYRFHRDSFYWVDVIKNKEEWTGLSVPCTQYSNREKAQPNRYVDLSKKGNVIEKIF
jgi:hypothetical protein